MQKWFVGGKLNLSHNCLDRHLTSWRKNKAAIIWEGEPGEIRTLTYQQLHSEVCRFANVLKSLGVKTGDRVAIYMGTSPELATAVLACARIGAPHTVIFGGFSAQAISGSHSRFEGDVRHHAGCPLSPRRRLQTHAEGGCRRRAMPVSAQRHLFQTDRHAAG